MTDTLWTKDGKLVIADGKLVICDRCPCGAPSVCPCADWPPPIDSPCEWLHRKYRVRNAYYSAIDDASIMFAFYSGTGNCGSGTIINGIEFRIEPEYEPALIFASPSSSCHWYSDPEVSHLSYRIISDGVAGAWGGLNSSSMHMALATDSSFVAPTWIFETFAYGSTYFYCESGYGCGTPYPIYYGIKLPPLSWTAHRGYVLGSTSQLCTCNEASGEFQKIVGEWTMEQYYE